MLLGLCLVTFLAIVIWPKEAKKEFIKTEEVEKLKNEPLAETPMSQEAGQEGLLPQKWPLEEPEETETDIIKTVQGPVTNYDCCLDMVIVDGMVFKLGSVDLTGIRIGDFVEITYTENRHGKALESITVIETRY
ncbi:MAG: hypothetical protein KAU38_06820 [Desulfobacterales bacterium]|nr:hypothetical protein [Desulfobacterales bacterium]